jgi:hypothetical protein
VDDAAVVAVEVAVAGVDGGDRVAADGEVAKMATLLFRGTSSPMSVRPSKMSTVPVGTPWPGATTPTVTVKVTVWPKTDEDGLLTTVTSVAAAATTCVIGPSESARKLLSPP